MRKEAEIFLIVAYVLSLITAWIWAIGTIITADHSWWLAF